MLFGILQNLPFEQVFAPNGYKPENGSIYQVSYTIDKSGYPGIANHHYIELPIKNKLEILEQSL